MAIQVSPTADTKDKTVLAKNQRYGAGRNLTGGANCPTPPARPLAAIKEAMVDTAALGERPERFWFNPAKWP